ncbi:hypothetical protein CEXT_389511 [Caerostris extrusa]|uniref:Histone-lysine N-methyltransferase n=1 Tax=Caerostris extrusa TaxID=172846 RepID=A0AAV4Q2Z3_CAEEX|nr:hypothetical protein CEXT_389511 [Caerostris extrusa]
MTPRERIIISPQQTLNSPVNINCNSVNPQNVMSNITLDMNNISLVPDNVTNVFNCGYNTAICNNAPDRLMSMPCNTLIIPPTPAAVQQSNPLLSQIALPQTVNVPDQVVPIYPQQDLNFGVISNPIQMHQPTEIHLSTMNVQHISVQSSFSGNPVNQLVFPQQSMPYPQSQVIFVEDPATHHLPQTQQPSNYVFQVPAEQAQNCAYTTYVPQQDMQPQFINQFAYQSNTHQISNQQVGNVYQHDAQIIQQPPGRLLQQTQSASSLNSSSINIPMNSHNILPKNAIPTVQFQAKQATQLFQSTVTPSPTPPDLSNRSSPASDISSSSKSCVSSITVSPNSNIVDFLKKAAEQMLSIKTNKTKDNKSEPEVPEKKTRFAHTRKVAARRAEKLKLKKAIMNGNTSQTGQIHPNSVKLNIIKPTFSIPFVKIPGPTLSTNVLPTKSEQILPPKPVSNNNSDELEKENETTMPTLQPEIPTTVEKSSNIYCYDDEESEEDSPLLKLHMRQLELEDKEDSFPKDKPYLMYEIDSEDGLHVRSRSLRDAWMKIYDELQDARISAHMKQIVLAPEDVNGLHMLGLDNPALMYLLEQLPGTESCPDYEFLFHQPTKVEIPENSTGCARSEGFYGRKECDMFNFLASEHRNRPLFLPPEDDEEVIQKSSRRAANFDLPIAMRFRFLKTVARETVGVYRSSIHGRGLFCKRNIDPGELVIEYAGEVIRSVLTDKRERIYQSKGIGCYMFRIDDDEVVDATMHGNAARFINHSCEPNCFSKVITVDGKKHIVIFALRRIIKGEELTYDYKFPFEDEKIPCHCNSRRCRKYLN